MQPAALQASMSSLTLDSFFGSPANRTRSSAGGKRARPVKKTKEVVAKHSKSAVETGVADADYSVQKQQMTCVPAAKDARGRDRQTGGKSLKPATKVYRISHNVAADIMRSHPDVFEWIKDQSGVSFVQCKYCCEVLDSKFKSARGKVDRHVKSQSSSGRSKALARARGQEGDSLYCSQCCCDSDVGR
jgi:hypothetical protein